MAYRMRTDLAYCLVDGRLVFLDIAGDRYFTIAGALAAAFKAFIKGEAMTSEGLTLLARAQIVEPARHGVRPAAPPGVKAPRKSVLENSPEASGRAIAPVAEAAWLVARARWRVKHLGFAKSLDRLRLGKAGAIQQGNCEHDCIRDHAAEFHAARRLIPAAPNCLTDSLALSDYLKRRGARAHFVIGVRSNPHSAHCWLQTDGVLLNEVADRAAAFTPILVI